MQKFKRGSGLAFSNPTIMYKYSLFFLFLLATTVSYGQELKAVYEYLLSPIATFREEVYFQNGVKTSVRDSLPQLKPQAPNSSEEELSGSMSVTLDMGKTYRNIIIQKSNAPQLVETRSFKGSNYLVSDEFPPLAWNTSYTDVDTLGKHICHKATVTYRGTTLVAYYTNDIPVPAGPYKFGGLPGLIVMLYNEGANPHYWLLKEIEYPYTGDVPVNEKYMNALPKLSLESFIKKEDLETEERMRMMMSKMPLIEGVTVERKKVRGSVEQVYEWEKN
ncbi:GLPGLI family protein [Sphingobacterium sp. DR205]|uniref:GLPGLI family protein n=1 Tax=Sphingobacterium sp. DR205 TaxID=2713573 RepID=UPI0013E43D72|nr:GLPGLI family protein [Sphingobacterium sp. DR205]QIH35571.1 GLPGLI family protein [Sphingobacterium sp. DR205]